MGAQKATGLALQFPGLIHLSPPRKTSGQDTDWSCWDHMPTSAPIIVAEKMGACNWLEMGHLLSLVAKAQGQTTELGKCPEAERQSGNSTWSGTPPPSKEQDLECR